MPFHNANSHVRVARERVVQCVQAVTWITCQLRETHSHNMQGERYGRELLYRAASFLYRWGSNSSGRRSRGGIGCSASRDMPSELRDSPIRPPRGYRFGCSARTLPGRGVLWNLGGYEHRYTGGEASLHLKRSIQR